MTRILKLWIFTSAAFVSAGWILSACHQVNLAGYAVFFFLLACVVAVKYTQRRPEIMEGYAKARANWAGWKARRLRQPLPLLFFLTAALAILGGAIHAPNNYDALTYRFPRLLHWWAESGWHWIVTPNERMNLSGTGFEWLMMPLFVVTHSDRLFFLINVIAYLLLPGLVFSVFTAAGMGRRAAWFWMWLLPAALCYAMQAGSISNDTIAATYFLTALYFAFAARRSGSVRDLWMVFLTAALLTGVKASNLPLLLPVAWVMWPALPLLRKQFLGGFCIILLGLLVSFLPTAVMNQLNTGDWSGDPQNIEKMHVQKPLAGILGNCLQLGLQCMEPPFLPVARSAENWVWDRFPEDLRVVLRRDFPRFGVGFRELPQEESSGLGIGVAMLAIISVVAALRWRRTHADPSDNPRRREGLIIGWLTWISLLVYMIKLGSEATSRLLAAYYPLVLLPLVLNPAQDALVKKKWYRGLAVCASAIALLAVIFTPSRPLWPAEAFLNWVVASFPHNELMARSKTIYTVYRNRNDLFADLRTNIPPSVSVVGFIGGGDDMETSLWRPYGERKVVDVIDRNRVFDPLVNWLVVKDKIIEQKKPERFDPWLLQIRGTLVERQFLREKNGAGSEKWSVVRLAPRTN